MLCNRNTAASEHDANTRLCVVRTHVIGRIHGAIVAATGRSDRRGDCRGDRRRGSHQLVVRLNRCSSPRRSPAVYTRGDCRGDRRSDSRPVYTPYKTPRFTHPQTVTRHSDSTNRACRRITSLNETNALPATEQNRRQISH